MIERTSLKIYPIVKEVLKRMIEEKPNKKEETNEVQIQETQ